MSHSIDAIDAKALENAVLAQIPPGTHVLAAVSGGADSMALLHILAAGQRQGRLRLTTAHFEHGLRGEESLADLAFVQDACRAIGISLLFAHADVAAECKKRRTGLEETARDMRRAFLLSALASLGGGCIATAHHANDQAETVLMRLFRGSSATGLAGMQRQAGVWIKPLLDCTREDMRAYLLAKGHSWREDSSNATECTPRNVLRNRILPQIEQLYPGAQRAIGRFAHLQDAENSFLHSCTAQWLSENALVFPAYTRLSLACLPHEAVLRRALKLLLGKNARYADIERLLTSLPAQKGQVPLPQSIGLTAHLHEGSLYLLPPPAQIAPTAACLPGSTVLPALGTLHAQPGTGIPVKGAPCTQELMRSSLAGACLRTWREGDRIGALGMHGKTRLLSDLYSQRRIPPPLRKMQVVLERDGEILWAVGCAISQSAALPKDATPADSLRLSWQPCPGRCWADIQPDNE